MYLRTFLKSSKKGFVREALIDSAATASQLLPRRAVRNWCRRKGSQCDSLGALKGKSVNPSSSGPVWFTGTKLSETHTLFPTLEGLWIYYTITQQPPMLVPNEWENLSTCHAEMSWHAAAGNQPPHVLAQRDPRDQNMLPRGHLAQCFNRPWLHRRRKGLIKLIWLCWFAKKSLNGDWKVADGLSFSGSALIPVFYYSPAYFSYYSVRFLSFLRFPLTNGVGKLLDTVSD